MDYSTVRTNSNFETSDSDSKLHKTSRKSKKSKRSSTAKSYQKLKYNKYVIDCSPFTRSCKTHNSPEEHLKPILKNFSSQSTPQSTENVFIDLTPQATPQSTKNVYIDLAHNHTRTYRIPKGNTVSRRTSQKPTNFEEDLEGPQEVDSENFLASQGWSSDEE